MKTCPFCAEEIQDTAIKCRYCGEFLTGSFGEDVEKTSGGDSSRLGAPPRLCDPALSESETSAVPPTAAPDNSTVTAPPVPRFGVTSEDGAPRAVPPTRSLQWIAGATLVAALFGVVAMGLWRSTESSEGTHPTDPSPEKPRSEDQWPQSINGWLDFHWGMTKDEAYRVAREKGYEPHPAAGCQDLECPVELKEVELCSAKFVPRLGFGDEERPALPRPRRLQWIAFIDSGSPFSAYHCLRFSLRKDLGPPTSSNDRLKDLGFPRIDRNDLSEEWQFPRTKVSLRYAGSDRSGDLDYIYYSSKAPANP